MRDSSPYKTIAVATTFSPRFKHVLAEAKRIRDRFGAELHLIYVGRRDEETSRRFSDVLAELELPADSPIHYEEGDPAEAILAALARENIDMLVAGALEKEIVLHPFLGNVARRLVRDANCSVMLFTHPEKKPKPLRRIVFVEDHSQQGLVALKTTLMLRLMKRGLRSPAMPPVVLRISRTMARKIHLKSSFCQPARLKFQLRRASLGALRASLHPILCDRWKLTCLSCRCREVAKRFSNSRAILLGLAM